MQNEKIAVLVVTYNRKDYLIKLLDSLINQDKKIESIFILDNHSSDNTAELLKELKIINECIESKITKNVYKNIQIQYYYNNVNSGGSGGFNKGMDLIQQFEFDYLWIMDDDVLPKKDCLSNLLSSIDDNHQIVIPNRSDELYEDQAIIKLNLSNPFVYKNRKKVIKNSKIENNLTEVVDMPFEGPLITRKLLQQVGLPNENLFIIFDDTDYATRSLKYTNIYFVKNAILHKQIIPKYDKKSLMDWKYYYSFRNQYWFDKKYGKNIFVKKLRPILTHIQLILRALLKRKFSNFKIIKAAYYDGMHSRLGKRVNPGKEFKWEK